MRMSAYTATAGIKRKQRGVRSWPARTGALGSPEGAEGREHDPDDELHRVLWNPGKGAAHRRCDHRDEKQRAYGRDRRKRHVPCIAAES